MMLTQQKGDQKTRVKAVREVMMEDWLQIELKGRQNSCSQPIGRIYSYVIVAVVENIM